MCSVCVCMGVCVHQCELCVRTQGCVVCVCDAYRGVCACTYVCAHMCVFMGVGVHTCEQWGVHERVHAQECVCVLGVHGGVHTGVSRQSMCVCTVSVGLWVHVHMSAACVCNAYTGVCTACVGVYECAHV